MDALFSLVRRPEVLEGLTMLSRRVRKSPTVPQPAGKT